MEQKPLPLMGGEEAEYLLALKQEFRGAMKTLPFFIQPAAAKRGQRSHTQMSEVTHREVTHKEVRGHTEVRGHAHSRSWISSIQFNSIQFICIAQFHKLQICLGVLYNLYT